MPGVHWRGLIVDIIVRCWDRDLYRDNKWLRMIHDNWLADWLDYRTAMTMKPVDKQIAALQQNPEIVEPLYWEEEDGETPLGGTIGFTYEFTDDDS